MRIPELRLDPILAPVRLPHPSGHTAIATSVDHKGDAVRFFVKTYLADPIFTGRGEYVGLLVVTNSSGSFEFQLKSVAAPFPLVEFLPTGETLVVNARCRKYNDGSHDQNARVYDSSGNLCSEFLLGDGIASVQTDRLGQIWVSYFDEGIFGNYGWKTPIGQSGLCCFAKSGERIWEYSPPVGFDNMCDCYALNVSRDGVWAYYYTDFPIVRIDSSSNVKGWKTGRNGGGALAVRDTKVLLYGGYGTQRTACQLLELVNEVAQPVAEVSLALPPDFDLAKAIVIGRDTQLHVFSGDDWFRFSLESLKSS